MLIVYYLLLVCGVMVCSKLDEFVRDNDYWAVTSYKSSINHSAVIIIEFNLFYPLVTPFFTVYLSYCFIFTSCWDFLEAL